MRKLLLVGLFLPGFAFGQNTLPPSQGVAMWTWNGSIWVPYNPGTLGSAATIADGADIAEGATTDGAASAGGTGTVSAKLREATALLNSINTAVGAAVPSGTNTIGNVNGAPNITATDCSGSVTTGGTAQNAFAAQTTLHGFTIANIDPTSGSGEPVWISFTTTAAASTVASYPLAAPTATTFATLSSFTAPPGFGLNHALSIIAATTGHKWSCTWW